MPDQYTILITEKKNESQHLTLEEITILADINTLRGTPGNSRWGVPPVSPHPDPISEQKCHFPHLFSDLASKIQTHMGRNYMSSLFRLPGTPIF